MSGYHKRDWETFPMHKIKRVDRPTTLIKDNEVQRVREREAGFCKASAGDYGPVLQQEFRRFVPKHPLGCCVMDEKCHEVSDRWYGCSSKGPNSK